MLSMTSKHPVILIAIRKSSDQGSRLPQLFQANFDPLLGHLFLKRILFQAFRERVKIDAIEFLILIEAREDVGYLAS